MSASPSAASAARYRAAVVRHPRTARVTFVDVRRAVDRELLNARRQGNGTADQRTGAPRSICNVAGRLIEHAVIEGFQANPDILRFHVPTDAKEPRPLSEDAGQTKDKSKRDAHEAWWPQRRVTRT